MNDQPSHIKPGFYRWIIFALLGIGYLLVFFHRLCPAVVALDLMNDLKAGGGIIGLLASAYFYPYALMQIPSGLLSDSWGPRKTITIFFILAGIASIGLGLAPTASWAILARVMVGIGVAMLFVPIIKILTCWFTKDEFSLMTGILIAIGGIGALIAASPLAYLSSWIGWRGSFIVIGILTLISSGAIWIFVRNTPEELGYAAVYKATVGSQPDMGIGLWQGMKSVIVSAHFWPLAMWFFFTFSIFFSFCGLWGGPYLMETYQLSKSQAGNILNMSAIAMIIGSPICSLLSDKVFHSRKKALILSSACMLLLLIPLAVFPAKFNIPLLYVWTFLFGFFGCAVVVVAFAASKESFPVEIAGTAMGLVNLFPFLGGAIMQPIIGFTLDASGKQASGYSAEAYGCAFQLFIAAAVLALIASCFIKETLENSDA